MGLLSRSYSGWGIGLFDFDNDGLKDIFTANSHVNDRVDAFEATEYQQHNTVFRNVGEGRFEDASPGAGLGLLAGGPRASRVRLRRFQPGRANRRGYLILAAIARKSGRTSAPEPTLG